MRIRFRNIKKDDDGTIVSGSADIVEFKYVPNKNGDRMKNHTQTRQVEKLGKVIWMDDNDLTVGIFNSPDRGLVFYDLNQDRFTPVSRDDERLANTKHALFEPRVHTKFGNTYLFFSQMNEYPVMKAIRTAFQKANESLYETALVHLSHDVLKNGSSIKAGEFYKDSMLSHVLTNVSVSLLDCDSPYYTAMADDALKIAYFKALIEEMRKIYPNFGRGCYVDSTPLEGEAVNNPFNALSSHGTDGSTVQSRLVLVLDIETNIPIWFEVIPANLLDKSTITSIIKDVRETLNVEIDRYDLDAGYSREELFEMFNRSNVQYVDPDGVVRERSLLVRMPAINGYPYNELAIDCKDEFYKAKYSFDYEHHTFYGKRVDIQLFGHDEYAFVYVDRTQAESLIRKWRSEKPDEWNRLTESAKEWYQVKNGYFVLIGNKDQSAIDALIEYRSRANIEGFFRDGKSYLRILPLAKWNKLTVKGKIFHDILETTIYREYRKSVAPVKIPMSSLIVTMDSWECYKSGNVLEKLGYQEPAHMYINDIKEEILHGKPMTKIPVTTRKKRDIPNPSEPLSPEEKLLAAAQAKTNTLKKREAKKLAKAEERADKKFDKAMQKAQASLEQAKQTAKEKLDTVKMSKASKAEKKAAETSYNKSITAAVKKYDKAKEKAESVREDAKATAKKKYDESISQIENSAEEEKRA